MTGMASIAPDPKKRGYLLPPGCKDLIDVLQGKASKQPTRPVSKKAALKPLPCPFQINGKIRAETVRVLVMGKDHLEPLGIMAVTEAVRLALARELDLVELFPQAEPPICVITDFGKFRWLLETMRQGKT